MSGFGEKIRGLVPDKFLKRGELEPEKKETLTSELESLIKTLENATTYLPDSYKDMAWAAIKQYTAEEIEKMKQPYAEADLGLPNSEKRINAIPNFLSALSKIDFAITSRADSDPRYILMADALESLKIDHAFAPAAQIPSILKKLLTSTRTLEI
ncbi:MAG: hypothetical protein HY918_02640 [Candidatus Doudnabacteria bacterium]|nr:hypothetical protein [Candidatus Doudnabacteria bacterium]